MECITRLGPDGVPEWAADREVISGHFKQREKQREKLARDHHKGAASHREAIHAQSRTPRRSAWSERIWLVAASSNRAKGSARAVTSQIN